MMRIYQIRDRLLQTARTHTLSNDECVALVKRYKITGVVNLWHTPDDRFYELVNWYEQQSLPDGQIHGYVAKAAEAMASRVATEIQYGGCVLVHCWGGRNRSGLISALALMRLEGITGAEAIAAVKAVRSGALVNRHFVEYLEKLQ